MHIGHGRKRWTFSPKVTKYVGHNACDYASLDSLGHRTIVQTIQNGNKRLVCSRGATSDNSRRRGWNYKDKRVV